MAGRRPTPPVSPNLSEIHDIRSEAGALRMQRIYYLINATAAALNASTNGLPRFSRFASVM